MYDVIIIGGGPAGLSAALILGRCLRRVLVCDAGEQRNARSKALYGFLTRNGVSPSRFLDLATADLDDYENVETAKCRITEVINEKGHFNVVAEDGIIERSRKLLLATGMEDVLPEIENLKHYFGKSIFTCPYCDGYESRGKLIGVIGSQKAAFKMAQVLKNWSKTVFICTNGGKTYEKENLDLAAEYNMRIYNQLVVSIEGDGDRVRSVVLDDGQIVACDVIYLAEGAKQKSDLAQKLGVSFDLAGNIQTGKDQRTNVPGVFVAGDVSTGPGLAIVAAAQGAAAAFAINTDLMESDKAILNQASFHLGISAEVV